MMKLHLFAVFAFMSLALAGCAATIGTSPKGLEVPIETASYKFATDVTAGGYKVVGTEELKKWIDEGKKVTIISTLPVKTDKDLGILPDAINSVMAKTEKELIQADTDRILKAAGTDKEKPIVVYCSYVACRRSHLGAKILVENGFKNVYRYPGGIKAWQEMGYPVTKNCCQI